ncbi:hypothetical protein BGW37DRAFT_491960 [Umbelopsis sp. PMI_123]|jgi:hypothetical protein|nr:hypothetical protein BGW37DRAFT_491960 [Umbelopsis sp. PMI_123]
MARHDLPLIICGCISITLIVAFYVAGFYFFATTAIGTALSEAKYINKVTHLLPTNCTILRASVAIGEDTQAWFVHVNYTTPRTPGNLGESHITLLEGTDIDSIYDINTTIPCFYSKYDLDFATLYNGPAPTGDIVMMIFFAAISVIFVLCPAAFAIYVISGWIRPYWAALDSAPDKVVQIASFVGDRLVKVVRRWKRFTPIAQSEEEAHDLEVTVTGTGTV